MANKIEMSLEEIIKSTKKMKVQRGGAAPSRRGGGGGAKPSHKGGRQAQTAGERKHQKPSKGNRGAAVLKDRSHGGIQKAKFSPVVKKNTKNQNKFDGPKRGRGGLPAPNFAGGPAKMLISNLDYGVSDADMKELFGEFGPVKSAAVHYDRSGKSLGTADVVYERKADALKAIKQYNGVPLDGRPMNIQLATSDVPSVSVKTRLAIPPTKPRAPAKSSPRKPAKNSPRVPTKGSPRTPAKNTRSPAKNKRGRNTGGKQGGSAPQTKGRRNAPKTPAPTAEALDAELDAYLNSQKTSQASVHPRVEIPE